MSENTAYILGTIGILLIGATYVVFMYQETLMSLLPSKETAEVHVHGDILFVINGTQIDLTLPQYQSSVENILHEDIHLHDNEGDVLHRHAEGITFAEFLMSIGFTLNETCLTLDTQETLCTDQNNEVALFVNGEKHTDKESYILQEEDQVLLYYGANDDARITTYLEQISDKACIYSGTCPERGTPPPESCGLTCEL